MQRIGWVTSLMALTACVTILSQTAFGQTELRRGVLQYEQLQRLAQRHSNTLSYGTLSDLRIDPNFSGSLQLFVNDASSILEGYRIVNRGGYFPENAGIPREQQLTRAEAAYRVYTLENGNELVLYRSPLVNTAEYFIRTPTSSF